MILSGLYEIQLIINIIYTFKETVLFDCLQINNYSIKLY